MENVPCLNRDGNNFPSLNRDGKISVSILQFSCSGSSGKFSANYVPSSFAIVFSILDK